MISIARHWTPRYIKNRIIEFCFRKFNPYAPWLTQEAICFLDKWLTNDKTGVEFGSGRSTMWIAKRCKYLLSVESNQKWYSYVMKRIEKEHILNVDCILAEISNDKSTDAAYLKPLADIQDNKVDFVLVDGSYRDLAAILATKKVASGGIVIIDNCNWFLPSNSRSPSSIPQTGTYPTKHWEEFATKVNNWSNKWTSNGVTDTVIFFKP